MPLSSLVFLLVRTLGVLAVILSVTHANAQDPGTPVSLSEATQLFKASEPLDLKLRYQTKAFLTESADGAYSRAMLSYRSADSQWDSIWVGLRARGKFRRTHCDNTPLKLKLEPENSGGTVFEGNKKLKLVLPCFNYAGTNDYVLKEYLAYKIYEKLAPYHFKTRLVRLELTRSKGKREKTHQLLGILVENLKNVADRYSGRIYKRYVRPEAQDTATAIENELFQYMIANTDFSLTYQHNQKQIWADKKMRSLPYDFDMSGFVNTDYAVVSKVPNMVMPINKVTERYYRGYKRDRAELEAVRKAFITKKQLLLDLLESHRPLFERKIEYAKMRDFLIGFFKIIESDHKFNREVVERAQPMIYRRLKTS